MYIIYLFINIYKQSAGEYIPPGKKWKKEEPARRTKKYQSSPREKIFSNQNNLRDPKSATVFPPFTSYSLCPEPEELEACAEVV